MEGKAEHQSLESASEFWDTHSVADVPSKIVEIEYLPEGRATFVATEDHLIRRLADSAKQRGVSVETLVNLWLQEKLSA